MEVPEIVKLLADYALAAAFVLLYVRSQNELVKAYSVIAEQRREENREMRTLLYELARRGVVRDPGEETGQFRNAYKRAVEKGEG